MTDKIHTYGYRAPRYCVDFHFLLQLLDPRPTIFEARCTELSENGLAAEVNASLAAGTHVTMTLTLPDSQRSVRIDASLTNLLRGSYGFAFTSPSADTQRHLRNYLESHCSSMVRSPEDYG
jgi:hypothetical protein